MAKKEFSKLGASTTDLLQASRDRLADAKALISAGRSAMAIAAGLYALEISLKTVICARLDLDQLPRAFEIHELEDLLLLAGLSRKIEISSLQPIKSNWEEILSISEKINELRYKPESNFPISQAHNFMTWLDDPTHGVLAWLSVQ